MNHTIAYKINNQTVQFTVDISEPPLEPLELWFKVHLFHFTLKSIIVSTAKDIIHIQRMEKHLSPEALDEIGKISELLNDILE